MILLGILFIVLVLLFLIAVVGVIVMCVNAVSESKKNRNSPVITEPAVVIKKKKSISVWDGCSESIGELFIEAVITLPMIPFVKHYDITYRTDSGQKVYQTLHRDQAKSINPGQRGMLTHKGSNGVKFEM